MEKQSSKRICYGFDKNYNGEWIPNKDAINVLHIFNQYLHGKSIRGIIQFLKEGNVSSPSGKSEWSPRAIEKILANESYIGLVSPELFNKIKSERERRSNVQETESGTVRKNTCFNSKYVFSGILVCKECGGVYRRITKHDGSVVWRCVNRVEKRGTVCKNSPSIPEEQLYSAMSEILGDRYKDSDIFQRVTEIKVCNDGSLEVEYYKNLNLTM